MEDAAFLAEYNDRLRGENEKLKERIPKLERRNRWDRFLLILMAIVSFAGMGFGRLYWQYEGSKMACPEPAAVAEDPKICKDGFVRIGYGSEQKCPHPEQTGQYLYRSSSDDLFICTCPRKGK